MNFPALDVMVAGFFKWAEGWAINEHQRTNDAGFAAIASMAGKLGAVLEAPENAADIAAIKKMAVQDLPSLTAPAPAGPAPADVDPPSSEQPSAAQRDMGDHAHGNRMDPSE